ncbi:unnamed protein product [Linum trigynum]|uniref:Uncharacterized protein n=1 Tax=Linum trigynum TaxID=586398 RepID=A0AAV2DI82_9ROSI
MQDGSSQHLNNYFGWSKYGVKLPQDVTRFTVCDKCDMYSGETGRSYDELRRSLKESNVELAACKKELEEKSAELRQCKVELERCKEESVLSKAVEKANQKAQLHLARWPCLERAWNWRYARMN